VIRENKPLRQDKWSLRGGMGKWKNFFQEDLLLNCYLKRAGEVTPVVMGQKAGRIMLLFTTAKRERGIGQS